MQRITVMSMLGGLLAVLMGIVPTARDRVGSAGNSTAAFDALDTLSVTFTEWMPFVILAVAAGAIFMSTNILR